MTETFAEFGSSPEAVDLIERLTGDKKWASSHFTEFRAEIVRWHEDCYEITEALGFCVFTSTAAFGVNPDNMTRLYAAATGIEMSEEEMMLTGRRVCTLEKAFNITRGATREHDNLPWRLMNEGAKSGPLKGATNSQEELDELYPPAYPSRPELELCEVREYYCPGCGNQLEVEAVPFGYPVVFDFLPDLDTFYREWLGRPLKMEKKFEDLSYEVIKKWRDEGS